MIDSLCAKHRVSRPLEVRREVVLLDQKTEWWRRLGTSVWRACPCVSFECLVLDVSVCSLKNRPVFGKGDDCEPAHNLTGFWTFVNTCLINHGCRRFHVKTNAEKQFSGCPAFCYRTLVWMKPSQAARSFLLTGHTYPCLSQIRARSHQWLVVIVHSAKNPPGHKVMKRCV